MPTFGKYDAVRIVEYDSAWPVIFETLAARLREHLTNLVLRVEHVGSTAVPGLAAKPIVDIDAIVASAAEIPLAIERLATIGYVHEGNLGVEGREPFRPPAGEQRHHLYLLAEGANELRRHLAFRDALRADARLRSEYGALKRFLADRHSTDVAAYTAGKDAFVEAALLRCQPRPTSNGEHGTITPARLPFSLRRGRPNDALSILEAQRSAIRGTAAASYTPAIIDEWAPPIIVPQRVEAFARWIERDEELIIVATDSNERIIGFGSIVPNSAELRALYVAAAHGRRGVGRAILGRLEELAREVGLSELHMDSSINAVPFYEANGFTSLEQGEHRMASGGRMACVRMRKAIRPEK